MYSCVKSYGINGIDAYAVTVETTLSRSIPSFDVVGLPDAAVKESRSRVQSALVHAGYELPVAKITVNLAPASQKKSGPAFDLPIFLAVMLASQQLEALPEKSAFVGELGLSGQLRPINGVLSMAIQAKADGILRLYVPQANAKEASIVDGLEVYPVSDIEQLCRCLCGQQEIAPLPFDPMLLLDGGKMSKSKGNVVDPVVLCERSIGRPHAPADHRRGGRAKPHSFQRRHPLPNRPVRSRNQPNLLRTARHRKKYACQAPAHHPAQAQL